MTAYPFELRTWFPGLVNGDRRMASTIDSAERLVFASEADARKAFGSVVVRHGVTAEKAIFHNGVRIA